MKELDVIRLIKSSEDWRDVLISPPYNLSIKEDSNYALLQYSQVDSDFHEKICRECRGLIIDKNTLTPVALSFYKFFNVQEPLAATIYWKNCRVQEKVDGSKILVWFDKYINDWRISTSGMLNASEAPINDFGLTFESLFDEAVIANGFSNRKEFTNLLNNKYCYTFELVSPKTRIVVPYKETKIYFIGLRDVETFEEVNPDIEENICKVIARPKEYALNNQFDCLRATEKMGYDEEGFVVVDVFWNRVKIKSPAYVAAHHMRANGVVNKGRVLEIIERGEKDEFLGYFPEYKDYFAEVESKRDEFFGELRRSLQAVASQKIINEFSPEELKWNRKDFAAFILNQYKDISAFLFRFLDTDLLKMFIDVQWNKLTEDKKLEYLYKGSDENED